MEIQAGAAMLRVLESWGADHLYGIPGGSINSLMDALHTEKSRIKYIQVRHEEVGAMAAACDAKLTGKIGVCFGSAGPGATHLFNGLYDAKMDHVPVLAIIGQVASTAMNAGAFQEMNENPMFADVAVYNRTVMTPESLPRVADEAIRRAYERKGVAVVTVPVDFGFAEIAEEAAEVSSAASHRSGLIMPDQKSLSEAVRLIGKAKRPALYVGQGIRGATAETLAFAAHFAMPIVSSVLAKGLIPDTLPEYMGTAARVASKPANEALAACDLIVFAGSDFPFARFFFPKEAKFIQIDIDSSKLGKRHRADVAILGDAREAFSQMARMGKARPAGKWLKANRLNRKNWQAWIKGFETCDDVPLRVEPVFAEINRIAAKDAVFVTDVGNCTIFAVRFLDMNGKGQQFTTSGLFATMGYGVPGGIAAKLSFPKRQVFTLSGDGAFAMVMQDISTQVRYGLPVINVVFSNDSLGFIDAEQEETNRAKFGVDLAGIDFAKAAEAMGAKGFTVRERSQLRRVFDEARRSKVPVVIDVKISGERPFPAEAMVWSKAFRKRYRAEKMTTLEDLL